MNLLADEGVDRQIVERLRQSGYAVQYVAEMDPGIDDATVLGRANESGAVLLTQDKDFGELAYRQNLVHNGIVLLRLAGMSPDQRAVVVFDAISQRSQEMTGAFAVVSAGHVRIRKKLGR